MKQYFTEIIFASVASVLCLLYILFPNPYLMAVFVFVVQPLFIYAAGSTIYTILKDLRKNGVI